MGKQTELLNQSCFSFRRLFLEKRPICQSLLVLTSPTQLRLPTNFAHRLQQPQRPTQTQLLNARATSASVILKNPIWPHAFAPPPEKIKANLGKTLLFKTGGGA